MSDQPELHARVSPVLGRSGTWLQRHVFRGLDGQIAEALCSHLAVTRELQPDDVNVPLCPLCWLIGGLLGRDSDVVEQWND